MRKNLGEYGDKLAGIKFVYPQIAADMKTKGWQVVWAHHYGTKGDGSPDWRPLTGTTGGRAEFPADREMPDRADTRIAFRPPECVKIFDVDHYGDKLGWHTIERAEEELGLLPPTWKVSSRGFADKSGRYMYRVREELNFKDSALWKFRDPETGATSVEVVRTDHRFSWAPGDINPKNGELVQCYDPDGTPCSLPRVDQVPYLPEEWQDFLADPPRMMLPQVNWDFETDETEEWWKLVPDNCLGTRDQLLRLSFDMALSGCDSEEIITECLRCSVALDLSSPWTRNSIAGLVDSNTWAKAEAKKAEWAQIVHFSCPDPERRKKKMDLARAGYEEHKRREALPSPTSRPAPELIAVAPSQPVDDLTAFALTRRFELDETGYVCPQGSDDLFVALDMVRRMYPHIRFAADAGHWLINHGRSWVDFGNKSEADRRAKSLAFAYGSLLEPVPGAGDADDEDNHVKMLKKVHAKLRSHPGAGAVAGTATAIAMGNPGTYVLVSELDTEPYVFWAGGIPWDLRNSTVQPMPCGDGEFNPVHRKTAAYIPDLSVPTPMWDAYLDSVWPDRDVRDFAVREIAGVALWGATSKTHPVLHGPASSGKSTFAEQLVRLLGSYAVQVSPNKLLTGRADSTAEEEFSRLIGARLAWMDEPPPRRRQAISEFNEMASGTGSISAAAKYKNVVTAPKLFNFLVCQNPRNPLSFDAEGVSERTVFIPCNALPHRTAGTRQAMLLAFEHEAPGILAKMIVECARFQAGDRYAEPVAVKEAFEDARHGMDDWGQTFTETYELCPPDLAKYKWTTLIDVTRIVNQKLNAHITGTEAEAHILRLGFEVVKDSKTRNQKRVNVVLKPVDMTTVMGYR